MSRDKDLEKLKQAVDKNDSEKEKEIERTIKQLKEENTEQSPEELYAESLVKIDELNSKIEQLEKEKNDAEVKLKNQKEANMRLINRLETRELPETKEVKHTRRDNYNENGDFIVFKH